MVNVQSLVKVADNTGAMLCKIIKILRKKHLASVGDFLIVTIRNARAHKKVKKGTIYKAVLIRQNRNLIRNDGSFIKFKDNTIVLLNNKNNPIGTRIRGPVCRELRRKGLVKVLSLASIVL
jgi:large subunit ribosomal protein L14